MYYNYIINKLLVYCYYCSYIVLHSKATVHNIVLQYTWCIIDFYVSNMFENHFFFPVIVHENPKNVKS